MFLFLAGALHNVSFDGPRERRSNFLADQVHVSSGELRVIKTIDINPENTPLVYSQLAARVMLRLETGSSSSQVIHQPRGRIMGLLRLTRDLPTVIEMRRLAGGKGGGERLVLSHYSGLPLPRMETGEQYRGQRAMKETCALT